MGLASFHANGYVREEAVRLLDGVEDGSEFLFLIMRLNDWVAAVQQCARRTMERRLESGSFDLFRRNLYFVFRLLEQRRSDHHSFVRAVVGRLVQPEHESLLLESISTNSRYVRRTAFRMAAEIPGEHLTRLVAAGVRADDPVIRLWAVRRAPSVFAPNDLTGLLRLTESDRFMAVRRETLRVRVEHLSDTAHEALTAALLDRSPAVREEARFHLRRQGGVDFAEFYRKAILDQRQIEPAIAGLGETGTVTDAALALPFLEADRVRLRSAAVRTVGRLAPEQNAQNLCERLTDDSPRVAREAAAALEDCMQLADADQLWKTFRSDPREHVRVAVVQLLDHLDAWRRLPYLIRAASEPNERVAARAMISISRMYNRVFTRPSADDKRKIQEALDESAGALERPLGTELRQWVATMME